MMKQSLLMFGLVTLLPVVTLAATDSDPAASCPGSIAVGDLIGQYAVNSKFEYDRRPAIPLAPGLIRVTALNAGTMAIYQKASNSIVGYLYIDQNGVRFVKLLGSAADSVLRNFGLPRKESSPFQVLRPIATPFGYELRRCR